MILLIDAGSRVLAQAEGMRLLVEVGSLAFHLLAHSQLPHIKVLLLKCSLVGLRRVTFRTREHMSLTLLQCISTIGNVILVHFQR